MPFIEVSGKKMYYETYGEGVPLVLLNGIMMSTASWSGFIKPFSTNYKLVLLDLVDQGKSDKADGPYTQDIHVDMLKEFFDKLGFEKVLLLGISYGGEVAMKFALKYQSMLHALLLADTTACTNDLMHDIEELWDYAASLHDGKIYFKATMPYIYSAEFYAKNIDWLKNREALFCELLTPEWYEAFRRANRSASKLNIVHELHHIKVPTLIIGAEYDTITPIRYQEEIAKLIVDSRFVMIKGAGHAAMYEKPYEFASIVLGYLNVYNESIEVL
ncbi:MAG: alpha/beta hydrolase [Clostridia bacterium]|jgi:pimeloyl-ACP methyl ester carboxylesterase|nr:alpha/beta hydrolase [Clostridia bacterium]